MARDRRPDGGEVSPETGRTLGIVLMTPVMVGIPQALGVFQADPILDFAWLGTALGLEPSFTNGLLLFGADGAVVLPLLFVVAGAFLPARAPVRPGVTLSAIIWTGSVLAFSLLSRWVYGLVLGGTVEYLVGMGPDQDVQDLHSLVAAQKTEHYEIAAYGNLAVIADRLGEGEIGDLLQETLEEEKAALDKVATLTEEFDGQRGTGAASDD